MSDFPKVLTFNREARTRIAIGMKSDLFMRCRPAKSLESTYAAAAGVKEDEEVWAATRDRLLPQLESDKPILILCESDLIALRVAVDSNPLGRDFRGWKKIERMLQDCGITYFKDGFLALAYTTTLRFPAWNIQHFPRMWSVDYARGVDYASDAYVMHQWAKPKFTLREALTIKRNRQEAHNEALKKFNPDPTKRRKR